MIRFLYELFNLKMQPMTNLHHHLDKLYIFEAICRHGTIHKRKFSIKMRQSGILFKLHLISLV